jgi:heterodisulfide reductase subunit A
VSVSQRPSINLMTYCEVHKVSGFIGNFKIEILKKARYVDTKKCTGCGQCWSHCPAVRIPSKREIRLGDLVVNSSETKARKGAKVVDVEQCVEMAEAK